MKITRGRGSVGTGILSSESLRVVRADEREVLNSPRSGFIEVEVDEDGGSPLLESRISEI